MPMEGTGPLDETARPADGSTSITTDRAAKLTRGWGGVAEGADTTGGSEEGPDVSGGDRAGGLHSAARVGRSRRWRQAGGSSNGGTNGRVAEELTGLNLPREEAHTAGSLALASCP